MSKIQVQLVKQPTTSTCVHACVSMVTGVPVDDLIKRFGESALTKERELTVLTEMGIYPVPMPIAVQSLMLIRNVFFMTVPSINLPGRNHAVVMEVTSDYEVLLHDPSPLLAYSTDAMQPSKDTVQKLVSYSEIVLLEGLPEHSGSAKRRKLYRARKRQNDE